MSHSGGKRAYGRHLGKDRSPRETRRSIARRNKLQRQSGHRLKVAITPWPLSYGNQLESFERHSWVLETDCPRACLSKTIHFGKNNVSPVTALTRLLCYYHTRIIEATEGF